MRISDWSSDVCSSDLPTPMPESAPPAGEATAQPEASGTPATSAQVAQIVNSEFASYDADKSNDQIGRASCRERVCQYVSISLVAGSLKTNTHNTIVTLTVIRGITALLPASMHY